VVPTGASATTRSRSILTYSLPTPTQEGLSRWYLGRLAMTVRFSGAPGLAYISAATRGRTFAQVKLRAHRRRVSIETLDLVRGVTRRVEPQDAPAHVSLTNYLQRKGVRAGRNTLTIEVEQYGGRPVSEVRVLRQTGIDWTRRTPYPLKLTARPAGPAHPRTGDLVAIAFRITDAWRGRALHGVSVNVDFDRRAFTLLGGSAQKSYGVLSGTQHGVFRLRALRSGASRVALFATSDRNRPGVTVRVVVDPRPGRDVRPQIMLGVAALAAGGLLIGMRARDRGDGTA
jgi:hypothetical protein